MTSDKKPYFARKELTTDPTFWDNIATATCLVTHRDGRRSLKAPSDVVIYTDETATERVAYIPWFYKGVPTTRSKDIMLNCTRTPLKWLPTPETTLERITRFLQSPAAKRRYKPVCLC